MKTNREIEFYSGDEKNINIEEGVTIIVGEELQLCAMDDCIQPTDKIICIPEKLRETVETVKMPDTVRVIGGKSFKHFKNLKEVEFSSNLEIIKVSAFLGCESLKTLHLPKSLKKIEAWAFGNIEVEDIYFDGSIIEFEKIDIEKYQRSFDSIGKVHCEDCVVDFKQEKFYISELAYKGTMEECKSDIGSTWIYEKSSKINCSDGQIDNTKA